MDRKMEIVSGGERVELNGFSQRIVLGTLLGLLGSLHGVDPGAELRVTIGSSSSAART